MKKNVLFKLLLVLTLISASLIDVSTKESRNQNYKYLFFQSFDVVSDAVQGIQQALDQKHKPYFVKRNYNILQDNVVVTTKSYYSRYRKKPSYKKKTFKANTFYLLNGQEAEIEFVYKSSDKNHLTQINKKVKNRVFKTKKIAFNTNSKESTKKNIIKI